MFLDFLQPQTVAKLGASQFAYTAEFTIAASTDGITPATAGSGDIKIEGEMHFFTEALFQTYPTTTIVDGDLIDDGECRLTLQLVTGNSDSMFKNPAKLSLLSVPGRMPVEGALTADGGVPLPGQAPHVPGWRWNRFLTAGMSVTHKYGNKSLAPATIPVLWRGWNIPKENCENAKQFWKIVYACQGGLAVS